MHVHLNLITPQKKSWQGGTVIFVFSSLGLHCRRLLSLPNVLPFFLFLDPCPLAFFAVTTESNFIVASRWLPDTAPEWNKWVQLHLVRGKGKSKSLSRITFEAEWSGEISWKWRKWKRRIDLQTRNWEVGSGERFRGSSQARTKGCHSNEQAWWGRILYQINLYMISWTVNLNVKIAFFNDTSV